MSLTPARYGVAAELQQLILHTPSVELFLEAFASHAAEIFGTETEVLAGVTLLRHHQAATVAGSSEAARALDEVQYGYGDGPCLHAARTGQTTVVDDMRTDPRWPDYGKAIKGLGFHSAIGVPILLGEDGGAALDLYARETGFFTPEVVKAAEIYAGEAAGTLQLAVQIAGHKDTAEHLHAALKSRTTIDLAVGIIMAQNTCSQDEAFNILRQASSHRNLKLRNLAMHVVQSVSATQVKTHFAD